MSELGWHTLLTSALLRTLAATSSGFLTGDDIVPV